MIINVISADTETNEVQFQPVDEAGAHLTSFPCVVTLDELPELETDEDGNVTNLQDLAPLVLAAVTAE